MSAAAAPLVIPPPESGKIRLHAVLMQGAPVQSGDGTLCMGEVILTVESTDTPESWAAPFATYSDAFAFAKGNGLIPPACEEKVRLFVPLPGKMGIVVDWINGRKENVSGLFRYRASWGTTHA